MSERASPVPRPGRPRTILAADWSKQRAKRAVWMADAGTRRIEPADGEGWDLSSLLACARRYRARGPVLVAMDLVIGVPRRYWYEAVRRPGWRGAENFLELLSRTTRDASFWGVSPSAADWSVERPFYAVPKGAGSRKAFDEKAGFDLRRAVDVRCGSSPPFCASGIPGTVGSGTQSLWRELGPELRAPRDYEIWPFDGSIPSLLQGPAIVIAELYPALAYAVALLPALPAHRLRIGKTKESERAYALERLHAAAWVAEHAVDLAGLDTALQCEDDFDALFGVAGLLRRVLDAATLDDPEHDDPVAEGGILLASAIDFEAPARRLVPPPGPGRG